MLAGGTDNNPLRLCSGYVWDHSSPEKHQGKLRVKSDTAHRERLPTGDKTRRPGSSSVHGRFGGDGWHK